MFNVQTARGTLFSLEYVDRQEELEGYVGQMIDAMNTRIVSENDNRSAMVTLLQNFNIGLCGLVLLCTGFTVIVLNNRRRNITEYLDMIAAQHDSSSDARADHEENGRILKSLKPRTLAVAVLLLLVSISVVAVQVYASIEENSLKGLYDNWFNFQQTELELRKGLTQYTFWSRWFSQFCELEPYRRYVARVQSNFLLNMIADLGEDAPEEAAALKATTVKLKEIQEIAMSLAAHSCDLGGYLVPEVWDLTWDYEDEDSYREERFLFVNRTLHYTDTASDLALSDEELMVLARATLSDGRYEYYNKMQTEKALVLSSKLEKMHSDAYIQKADMLDALMLYTMIGILVPWPVLFMLSIMTHMSLVKAEAPFSLKRLDLALIKQRIMLQVCASLGCECLCFRR